MDVAPILRGEFTATTGEEDRKAAQQHLPLIAAEYERRVAEARSQLAACAARTPDEAYQETEREQEERQAREAFEAAQAERRANPARRNVRLLYRQYQSLTTAELPPEQAAAVDIFREKDADLAKARETIAYLEARIREQGAVPITSPASQLALTVGKTVENLIAAYEADKSPGWSGSTKKAVVPVFRILREVFPGRTVDSITREDARAVVKLLEGLPVNMRKRKELRGLTVSQAVEKGKVLGLPTIQPKTINDGYLLHIASMFNWARKEQWVASSPFEGLSVHDPVHDADRRDPFTAEQLQRLFTSTPWQQPWEPGGGKPGAYWVPLLCLFHGLRNGEAAGLRVEDVGEEEGLPVLRVTPYDDRRLKNNDARATLPIHPELIRLGFLQHVEQRRSDNELLLFPEGVVNDRGQVGAKLGERFSARVKALGLVGRKLGMHSFRHNFEDRLRAAELAERTALALARRTEPGSGRVYGNGLSLRQKAEAVAKVNYPGLDLSHLYPRLPGSLKTSV